MPAGDPTQSDVFTYPGAIKINVQGAFIVDQETPSPVLEAVDGLDCKHDSKDIRLPNHTVAVSHVAVDVCLPP